MPVATALAIFFLIWWVALFAVLPWGVRSQHEGQEQCQEPGQEERDDMVPGTDPGAPVRFRLGRTLLWTTLVSAAVYAAGYLAYAHRLVSLEALARRFGL